MSKIRANQITNENCNGAPTFTNGLNSIGIITCTTTATTFSGNLTVTGNLGASGTLTYEDVSSIDSVGIITARSGVKVGPTAGVGGTAIFTVDVAGTNYKDPQIFVLKFHLKHHLNLNHHHNMRLL